MDGGNCVLRLLTPDLFCASLYDVDLAALRRRGIVGIIVDLDNTLVKYSNSDVTSRARRWVHDARETGLRVCIASNARTKRVQSFSRALNVPAIANATKPTRRALRRALRLLNTSHDETAIIGDQMFTDVLGGNRMGLYTVLVNPLSRVELGATRVMRRLEGRVLNRMRRRGILSEDDWHLRHGTSPDA